MTPHDYLKKLIEAAESRGYTIVAFDPNKVILDRQGGGERVTIESRDPLSLVSRIAEA